jgi:hypothetical protein
MVFLCGTLICGLWCEQLQNIWRFPFSAQPIISDPRVTMTYLILNFDWSQVLPPAYQHYNLKWFRYEDFWEVDDMRQIIPVLTYEQFQEKEGFSDDYKVRHYIPTFASDFLCCVSDVIGLNRESRKSRTCWSGKKFRMRRVFMCSQRNQAPIIRKNMLGYKSLPRESAHWCATTPMVRNHRFHFLPNSSNYAIPCLQSRA